MNNQPPLSTTIAQRQLTIVIPAYCEQDRLALTTNEVISAALETLDDFEVIIINDGSTDNTRAVADILATKHKCVSVIHFETNRGVGAAYRAGLEAARYGNISLVPGDQAFEKSGLLDLFSAVGKADMIISYSANPRARSPVRRQLSRICTMQLRITTRCWLRDGHSLYVWPVKLARSINIPPDYSYHLVTLVSLLQKVTTYAELPVTLTPKPDEFSRVLRLGTVATLAWRLSLLTIASFARLGIQPPRKVALGARFR
ncbi:glycosyltransferase family 2 protein [Polynucleobacter sp. UB-Tiil-W10]|uniref:glycosyltransferase family 2 protein n=1 Tax=Polynucleobacter sp. UB-Tiil-W10 TaxID=1855648 RepID=UPI001C0A98D0|nr:glycosyltransferase family 2 protein [Polynucleobacter sp. UB-Tiil-W10]MBU3540832.1 glycosyltransferase family 2 protein [Polynucleobacter sp. UB-Tiil-W10]